MSIFKAFVFFCIVMLSSQFLLAQASAVVQYPFAVPDGYKKLQIDLNSEDVEVRSVQGSRIFIEQHIKINSENEYLLAMLSKKGRYELSFTTDENDLRIIAQDKKDNPTISIRNIKLKETFKYIIFVPARVEYVNFNDKELILQ